MGDRVAPEPILVIRAIGIGFHDVVEEMESTPATAPAHTTVYTLDRRQLRSHLQAIRSSAGCEAVCRIDRLRAGAASVFLTFDDGDLSAYTCVAGELESFGWPGHIFITTNRIGRWGSVDRHQIRELHERGHVIGSHSLSHPERMSHLKWEELVREWSESCRVLSDIVGERVRVASLPGGYYSRKVARAAAASGIEVLFTSEPTMSASQVDGCLVLGRYSVHRLTSSSVVGAIAAGATWPRFHQVALWLAKKGAKRATGRGYFTIRRLLLDRLCRTGR